MGKIIFFENFDGSHSFELGYSSSSLDLQVFTRSAAVWRFDRANSLLQLQLFSYFNCQIFIYFMIKLRLNVGYCMLIMYK